MFKIILTIVFLFLILGAANIYTYLNKDYSSFFIKKKGVISEIKEELVQEDENAVFQHLIISSDKNYEIEGFLRKPKTVKRKYPAVILLGGIVTGKDVINLVGNVEHADSVIFLSMDYPYDGKKKFKGFEILGSVNKIRNGVFNSISGVMLAVDYLSQRNDIDLSRLYIAGVSFGGFAATTAAGIDKRIKALVIVYCGGDIRNLLIHNMFLNKNINSKILTHIVGNFSYFLIRPNEPLFFVDKISPRPILMISGENDERIPKEFAMKLYNRAKEPKDIIWFDTKHIYPTKSDITQKITEHILMWFLKKDLI